MKKLIIYIFIIAIALSTFYAKAYALRPPNAKTTVTFFAETQPYAKIANKIFAAVRKARQRQGNGKINILCVCEGGAVRSPHIRQWLERSLAKVHLQNRFTVAKHPLRKLVDMSIAVGENGFEAIDYHIIISTTPFSIDYFDIFHEDLMEICMLFADLDRERFPKDKIEVEAIVLKGDVGPSPAQEVITTRLVPILEAAIRTNGECTAEVRMPQVLAIVNESA